MRKYSQNPNQFKGGTGKFAAKLTFEQRCALYYAGLAGVPDAVILAVSGMHRSSVTRLLDGKSKAYKNIREKYDELGQEEFAFRYYTPEMQAWIATGAQALVSRLGRYTAPAS